MITVTDSAAAKVKELLEQEDEANLALRVAVRPGTLRTVMKIRHERG